MKGLYLNIPDARTRAAHDDNLLEVSAAIVSAVHHGDEIVVDYHAPDWPEGPLLQDRDHDLTLAASGWFLLRGRPGNLRDLAEGFLLAREDEARRALLAEITAGAFVILFLHGTERWVATDPFGLHPHYHLVDAPLGMIAPSPCFLARGVTPAEGARDEALSRAHEQQGHLFGNYTAYRSIQRLPPGALLGPGKDLRYFDYSPPGDSARVDQRIGGVLVERLSHVLQQFGPRARILPLSGGLDSRLLLSVGSMDYGYTFGPRDTGDRPVARRFAGHFKDYDEFSFLDLRYPLKVRQAGRRLLDGVCAKPFLELLPAYQRLYRRWGAAGEGMGGPSAAGLGALFLDGYCGDVLQRGTYLTWGGVDGSLAKLIPGLGRRGFDPHRRLDQRYAALEAPVRALLHNTFDRETAAWKLDPLRSVTLFELLYGRGSRYTLNGGTILSGQFFTPVQPFFFPEVFRSLWAIDPADATSYRAMREIWRGLPLELARVRTYSGFVPVWQHDLARATMLVTKALGKKRVWKRAVGYEGELGKVRWEEE